MNRVSFEHDRIINTGAEDGPEHVAGRPRVNLEDKEQERDNIFGEGHTNTTDPAFEKVAPTSAAFSHPNETRPAV